MDTSILPAVRKTLQSNAHFRCQGVIIHEVNFKMQIRRKPGILSSTFFKLYSGLKKTQNLCVIK